MPETHPHYAIPLTIDETARLAGSLCRVDTLTRAADAGRREGELWARQLGATIAATVGRAKARSYAYVPISEKIMQQIDTALIRTLDLAPGDAATAGFEALVMRMHMLAGMARALGWALSPDADEPTWYGGEPERDTVGGELDLIG